MPTTLGALYHFPVRFVSSTSNNSTASAVASININRPAGLVDGDLLVAVVMSADSGTTWTGPSGWTESADSSGLAIYRRIASTEPTSWTFTPSASRRCTGVVMAFRNAVYVSTIAVSTADSNNPITIPSISLANPKSTVVAIFGALGSPSGAPLWGTPSNYVSVYNLTGGGACSQSISYRHNLTTASGNIETNVAFDTSLTETTAAFVIRPA